MEYKKFENTIILRIDKGEEIIEKIKEVACKEKITLANISALGATNDFTVGVFKTQEKKYYANHFEGDFELELYQKDSIDEQIEFTQTIWQSYS